MRVLLKENEQKMTIEKRDAETRTSQPAESLNEIESKRAHSGGSDKEKLGALK